METDVSRMDKSGVSRLKQCAEDDDGEGMGEGPRRVSESYMWNE